MLLPCALLVSLVLSQAKGQVELPPSESKSVTSWLVVRARGEQAALVLDAVRERYLFPLDSPPPRPEETFLDARGEPHRWLHVESEATEGLEVVCACADLESPRREVVMANLRGAGVLYVNGLPFAGDRERRGDRGVPIELREGHNALLVAEIDGAFELELWEPEAPLVIADWAVRHSTLGRDPALWFFTFLDVPVFNATAQPLTEVDLFHCGLVPEGSRFPTGLGESQMTNLSSGALPPLCQAELVASPTAARQVEVAHEPLPADSHAALLEIRCGYEGPSGSGHVEEILRIPYAAPQPHHEAGPFGRRSEPGSRESIRRRVGGTTIVYGSHGSAAETELLLAQARFIQQRAGYRWSVTPEIRRDVDYLEAVSRPWRKTDPKDLRVLLLGNEDSNAAFEALLPVNRRLRAFAGQMHIGGRWWPGEDLLAIHSVSPHQTVIAATGETGARLGLYFDFDWLERYEEVLLVRPTVAPGALARFTDVETTLPEPIEPKRWLVVDAPPDAGAAIGEAVCAQYVLAPNVARPRAGEPLVDVDGGTHEWIEHDLDADPSCELRCAFAELEVDFNGIHMARLTGAERLFVNGAPIQGDPELRGDRGFPVSLRQGRNELFVLGAQGDFELELWMSETALVSGTWGLRHQEMSREEGWAFGPHAWMPLFNASEQGIDGYCFHYGKGAPGNYPDVPPITEWADSTKRLHPLAMCENAFFTVLHYRLREDSDEPLATSDSLRMRVSTRIEREHSAVEHTIEVPFGPVPPYRLPTPSWGEGMDATTVEGRRAQLSRTTLIFGSQGTPEETEALLARARLIQQVLWYRWGVAPDLCSDEEVLRFLKGSKDPAAWRRRPLVLIGNRDTNKAWGLWVTPDCPVQARRGGLRIGEQRLEGDGRAAIYRLDASCTVAIDTGLAGQRLGSCIDPEPDCAVGEAIVFRRQNGAIESISRSIR